MIRSDLRLASSMRRRGSGVVRAAVLAAATTLLASAPQDKPGGQGFSFKTGVELINVAATVTDDSGNSTTANVALTIADGAAPVISSVTASPNVISPPNGSIIPVTVTVVASDNCGTPVNQIISITANEPVPAGDIQITGALTANLRASKNPTGDQRIYTITVGSKDASGNCSTSTVTVTVLKNQSGK